MLQEKTPNDEGRRFVRHPTHIPIEVQATDSVNTEYLDNVSLGGMAFNSNNYWEQGSVLNIRIPDAQSSIDLVGKVVWCRKHKKHFDVGIQFMCPSNNPAVKAMVDEVCQVEMYKKMIVSLVTEPSFLDDELV